jgi:hypothetical protein
LDDAPASRRRFRRFIFDDRRDQFWAQPSGPDFRRLARKEQPILTIHQGWVKRHRGDAYDRPRISQHDVHQFDEQGWHPDLIDLQLAHAERNAVRTAYNTTQRLPERRTMWADYLDSLRQGASIIPLFKSA